MKYRLIFSILFVGIGLSLFQCQRSQNQKNENSFLNVHDSVEYVGMQTCRSCHQDIYNSYIQTGMGQSFDAATLTKTKAAFGPKHFVYDSLSNYYYYPFFKDSSMYVLEYRLKDKDTVHSRLERIDYIIGSGHHTNSHFIERNGYLYQAPITFYTQDGKWDLAPGFEEQNQRFERAILSECLTCHNHLPTPASGSNNKYRNIPLGIECERCHGPGEIHVREKLAGKLVDTSKFVDYTITNPRHLSIDRQMDLCQRCHLQGVAVLNEGKTFYDFKPGMALSDVMNVYLPRFTNSDEKFIMASQADRLRLSNCFTQSRELSCITCHNPHHDVHSTTKNNYNTACISCHNKQTQKSKLLDCAAPLGQRNKFEDNCVKCHLPKSGSIDIPHVNITDHYISRKNIYSPEAKAISQDSINDIANFLGLQSLVKENPTNLDVAKGYLALYDKFMAVPAVLDSAFYYLTLSEVNQAEQVDVWIHYYFNQKEYSTILSKAPDYSDITNSWTAYRAGEAAYKLKALAKAKNYYQKAVEIQPYNLDFQEKYGTTLAQLGEIQQAQKVFDFILSEDNERKIALANFGLLLAQLGKSNEALKYYNKALFLDPDYKNALLNKVTLLLYLGRMKEYEKSANELILRYPEYKNQLETLKKQLQKDS